MSHSLVIVFRDGVVHKIGFNSLEAAQKELKVVGDKFADRTHPVYRFKNEFGDLIFTANIDNIQYSFIEENKE